MGINSFYLNQLFPTWWSNTGLEPEVASYLSRNMKQSYEDPSILSKQIIPFCHHITGLGHSRASEDGNCDFYRDCVVRHLGKKRIAFKVLEGHSAKEWTFEQLHSYVNYESARWKRRGLSREQTCAIVLPFGIHSVVALLTALKLGITFFFLPTDSPSLSEKSIHKIIENFSPDHVITDSRFCSLLPSLLLEYLEEEAEGDEISHVYSPEEIVQYAITCYRQKPREIIPVPSGEMYFNALRDALFYLGLKPGVTWAYPLACSLKEQPYNLLMAFLVGATTIHIPSAALRADPSLLKKETVNVLGISSALESFSNKEFSISRHGLKFLYRNPFSENLLTSWQDDWIEENKLEKVPFGSLLIANSFPGILLASPPHVGKNKADFFWPALGTSWELRHIHQEELKSSLSYGIFEKKSPLVSKKISPGNLILVPLEKGWKIGTTVVPHQDGETFPIEEVENGIKELDFVEECTIIHTPDFQSLLQKKCILLVFVSPSFGDILEENFIEWTETINRQIQTSVAPCFIPHKIEYYPSCTQVRDRKNAYNLYSFQYNMGILEKKKQLKVYHTIDLLRKSVQ